MIDIRSFIDNQLLEPLKNYPTRIQDTMLEIIKDRLETLYQYTVQFPEIISPGSTRLDILRTIAEQFVYTIRDEADLEEQVEILNNILYVYSKRGSIDTIENMWKYYGGDLPKDVKVVVPSHNLFRYSISKLSGTHQFVNDPDYTGVGSSNRPGAYEIRLNNSTYPIPKLREFMLKELVAAGNRVFFTNTFHMESLSDELFTNPHSYKPIMNTFTHLQLEVLRPVRRGLFLSGEEIRDNKRARRSTPLNSYASESKWSGALNVFLEMSLIRELPLCKIDYYTPLGVNLLAHRTSNVKFHIKSLKDTLVYLEDFLYCTSRDNQRYIGRHLYDSAGELITDPNPYPGWFVLGVSLLGEEVV